MLKLVVTMSLLVAAATPVAQERWEQIELEPQGMEYRLPNDDGAVIILVCQTDGVVAGFEFPEPLDNPGSATLRSIPGQRENVAVTPVSDRVVRVTGNGITVTLALLRAAARLHVRIAGESAMFATAGSRHIIDGCFARQEVIPGGIGPIGVAPE